MLSLDKLKAVSAAAAAEYFLDLDLAEEVGDYYLGEDGRPQRALARVLGELGPTLGLADAATYRQFLQLLDGRHPLTGKRLIPWRSNRVSAIDITASPPKSVSVLWALGDDQLRKQVQAAQDKAVQMMFAHMEQNFDVVRYGSGKTERAVGFLAVAFAHHTSRQTARAAGLQVPPDPQLHTHILLMMARRKDGRMVAIGNQDVVWTRRGEAMGVYHAELAAELARLGFSIERLTGRGGRYFEVAGIPHELCRLWSSRRKEIAESLETWSAEFRAKYGRDPDMVERREPAVRSRMKKGGYQVRDLRKFWQVVGEHYGVSADSLRDLQRPYATLPERAFAEGLLGRELLAADGLLTARHATFTGKQARIAALERAAGLLPSSAALEWLDRQNAAGELVEVADDVWTTREMLQLEQEVIGWNARRADVPSPALPTRRQVWDAVRKQPVNLSLEQLEALQVILGQRTTYVTGHAGVGKGVVARVAADVWRAQGRRVFALALAGATAQRLGAQLGNHAESMTLHSFLGRVNHGRLSLARRDVLVIDEAGMIDTLLWAEVARAVGTEATVVAMGDHAQLSPIRAGGLWPLLSAGGPRLTEVQRTKLEWERAAWGMLRRGESQEALEAYARHGQLTLLETRAEAISQAIDDWSRDGHRGLIVTDASNAERHTANQVAQRRRLQRGELGVEAVPFSTVDGSIVLHTGDRVIFKGIHRLADAKRVENGTTGTIVAVDVARGEVTVQTSEPVSRRLVMPSGPRLDLNYAAHVFKAQGATLDRTYIVAGGWQTSKESLYVACSRSRRGSHLYLDRETLERSISAEALAVAERRAGRTRAKVAALTYAYGRRGSKRQSERKAPREPLLWLWQRRRLRRAVNERRAARTRPRVNGRSHRPPSPAAVAFAQGVPEWVAYAAQRVTGRPFGATG
jgi:conjugative relaxase-like TrwC/TraI family protein